MGVSWRHCPTLTSQQERVIRTAPPGFSSKGGQTPRFCYILLGELVDDVGFLPLCKYTRCCSQPCSTHGARDTTSSGLAEEVECFRLL